MNALLTELSRDDVAKDLVEVCISRSEQLAWTSCPRSGLPGLVRAESVKCLNRLFDLVKRSNMEASLSDRWAEVASCTLAWSGHSDEMCVAPDARDPGNCLWRRQLGELLARFILRTDGNLYDTPASVVTSCFGSTQPGEAYEMRSMLLKCLRNWLETECGPDFASERQWLAEYLVTAAQREANLTAKKRTLQVACRIGGGLQGLWSKDGEESVCAIDENLIAMSWGERDEKIREEALKCASLVHSGRLQSGNPAFHRNKVHSSLPSNPNAFISHHC